ncbi:hypothetical protein Poly51_05790 [Rubripirellula tenax]|uniref:Uncharacterized protein n=1 Tax=Rubripirellula tenax TaxID=2528015 RepID=A0A5C6FKK1_9BACT|nr:hypothetical protein Poly51_05790 [Rubripirellula tenax]
MRLAGNWLVEVKAKAIGSNDKEYVEFFTEVGQRKRKNVILVR